VVAGDESGLVMWHESAGATVLFDDSPQPPPLSVVGEEGHATFLDLDDGKVETSGLDEVAHDEQESSVDSDDEEDEDAELYDSDNDDEEDEDAGGDEDEPARKPRRDDERNKKADSLPLVPGTVVSDGQLLGPPRFAAVKNTAAFMRLAAAEGGREIVVLYRYTRFSRTWSGRRGVEKCRQTKLHRLRFAVPPAGDVVGSLAWVGASLGPLIYPALFCRELQELWAILTAAPVNIPPRATQLQVMVDAAILRRDDYTAERMEHMRGALESEIQEEAWPERCHVGMVLNLPEPVPDGHEEDQDARPAKRRRTSAPCASSRWTAAWPCQNRHLFHGECLEKTLATNHTCPLCRNDLVVR
jgi:hypothetical protein